MFIFPLIPFFAAASVRIVTRTKNREYLHKYYADLLLFPKRLLEHFRENLFHKKCIRRHYLAGLLKEKGVTHLYPFKCPFMHNAI